MTSIFLSEPCRLKSYAATTKNGKTVVRVEIETADHSEAGYLLDDLQKIIDRQKAASRAKPDAQKPAKLLALPAPALQLTFRGDGE
ncbi:hypothetical protein ACXHXM_02110